VDEAAEELDALIEMKVLHQDLGPSCVLAVGVLDDGVSPAFDSGLRSLSSVRGIAWKVSI
jgi:hypothetical protein